MSDPRVAARRPALCGSRLPPAESVGNFYQLVSSETPLSTPMGTPGAGRDHAERRPHGGRLRMRHPLLERGGRGRGGNRRVSYGCW